MLHRFMAGLRHRLALLTSAIVHGYTLYVVDPRDVLHEINWSAEWGVGKAAAPRRQAPVRRQSPAQCG